MFRMLQAICVTTLAALVLWAPGRVVAQQASQPAAIRVVDIPIANYSPLLVARDKGYFAQENLSVT